MSVCTSITQLSNDANGELLEVIVDNTVRALWYYPLADAMQFLNQEVIVEYRKDVYNGQLEQFIKTFTVPTVVNTLDKKDNIKLYIDQVDNNSNLSFNEIAINETRPGCMVYCTKQEYKTSANAVWMELLIRDKTMRVATLRIFDYENKDAALAGHYICCDLTRSKFGFQTTRAAIAQAADTENPELEIARQYVMNYFATDVAAMQFINKYQLFEHFKQHVDYEPGYGVMRLAMELAMCDSLHNITRDADVDVVAHVLLASYGYVTRSASILSSCVNNVFLAQSISFPDKAKVCTCLDECLEEHPHEYEVVKGIRGCVDTLLRIRKGVE